ncbi:MAG TPA: Veg protein [Thermoanaerobacterales bacterium]|nr:Veg protein [Thermoanaerobacterales bacterium]
MNNIELLRIKKDIESNVGQRVRLKSNRGRRRIVEREGILEKTYPNIFVVRIDEDTDTERKVSYSYTDILTETVEVTIFGEDGDVKIKRVS